MGNIKLSDGDVKWINKRKNVMRLTKIGLYIHLLIIVIIIIAIVIGLNFSKNLIDPIAINEFNELISFCLWLSLTPFCNALFLLVWHRSEKRFYEIGSKLVSR